MNRYQSISQYFPTPRTLLLSVSLGLSATAYAQTNSLLPIPFVTTIAGIPAGSGTPGFASATPACTGYKNINGQSLGDGCPATGATLVTLYDAQTDLDGNIYISENGTDDDIRVIYKGGATLSAMLIAANSQIANFAVVPGNIYTLAGSFSAALSTKASSSPTTYYCGNLATVNGAPNVAVATTVGDGCPAAQSYIKPRGVTVDKYGNVFTVSNGGGDYVRVIYAGGVQNTLIASLITKENALTSPPIAGYIYKIAGTSTSSYTGDGGQASSATFVSLRYIAVDNNENIYVSDGTTQSGTSPVIEAANNNVRVIYVSGVVAPLSNLVFGDIYTLAGENSCTYVSTAGCPYGASADNVPAPGALLNTPYALFTDANNNLYIADYYNSKIRVVYQGGTIAGINGAGGPYSNPTPGDIYTFAGGGASAANGTAATQVKFTNLYTAGIDPAGNVYAHDGTTHVIWKFDAKTGIGNVLAGGTPTTTVATSGKFCNGTSGPLSLDSMGDGCPGPQAALSETGHITFDPAGNFYTAENSTALVRKYSYDNEFAATAVGSSLTAPLAFEATTATVLTGESFVLQGVTTAEFRDAGGDDCATSGAITLGTICTYNVSFDPAHEGARQAAVQLNTAAGAAVAETLSGVGNASDIAIDAGTQTIFNTGVASITLTSGGSGYTSAPAVTFSGGGGSGATATASITGGIVTALTLTANGSGYTSAPTVSFSGGTPTTSAAATAALAAAITPNGIAADLLGNVYIADSVGNQVLKGASSGTKLTALITGLNKPSGIAIDGFGDIYVADTGNNRILETTSAGATIMALGTGLAAPKGVAVDLAGNIYVADTGNNRVLQVFLNGSQMVLPITGLSAPTELAVSSTGVLYVVDSGNKQIESYANNTQTTVTLAAGIVPSGVAVDAAGDLYVTDSSNLQLIEYAAGSTVADVLLTTLKAPVGVASDADANIFIADMTAGAIELQRSLGDIVFPITNVGSTSTESLTVNNVGNVALTFPGAPLTTVTGNPQYTVVSSTTNGCGAGTSYAAGAQCFFSANFAPTVTGAANATVKFNTNATNTGTASALLMGSGLFLTPTTLSLVNTATTTIYYPQTLPLAVALDLTSTGAPINLTGPPAETFSITIDNGIASKQSFTGLSTPVNESLQAGVHQIKATYSSDGNYASSSATISVTIAQAPTVTTLTIAPANLNGSVSLLFTATVSATTTTQIPTGSVKFYAGTVLIGTGVLSSPGVYTYSTPTLAFASNSFTAVYSGDGANFAGSTSVMNTPPSDFAIGAATTSFSTSQGGVITANFTISALYGGTGTITPSCTGLPANSLCRFQPLSFTLGTTPQQVQLLLYTNVNSTLAENREPFHGTDKMLLAFLLPFGGLLTLLRKRSRLQHLVVFMVFGVACFGLTGCNGSTSAGTASAGLTTPTGTSTVNIVFTGSNGITTTHTQPISVTVIADSGPF
jgi:sugar lactone lactonase YvrE